MGCVSTSSQVKQQKFKTPKFSEVNLYLPNSSKATNDEIISSHLNKINALKCDFDTQKRKNQTKDESSSSFSNTPINFKSRPSLISNKSITMNQQLDEKPAQIQIKSSTKNFIVEKKNVDVNQFYEFLDIIGEGSNGKVYKAIQKSTGKTVALKQIKNVQKNQNQLDKIMSEIKILKKLNHPNLIKTLDVILNEDMTYIATEFYTGCTLNKVIEKSQKYNVFFSEVEISKILKQILSALSYLHDKQIIHRDIKPENIIFANNEYDQIKIIDLGYAIYKKDLLKTNQILGTPYYIAPEIITEETVQDEKSDIWSLGVVLYEMLTNRKPVKGDTMDILFLNLVEKSINFDLESLKQYSHNLINLLKQMLNKHSQARISARKALSDVFFQDSSKSYIRKKVMVSIFQSYYNNSPKLNILQEIMNNYICQFILDFNVLYDKKIIQTYQALESKTNNCICKKKLVKAIKHALKGCNDVEIEEALEYIQFAKNKINFSTFLRKTLKTKRILTAENVSMCFRMLDIENKQYLKSQFLRSFFKKNIKNSHIEDEEYLTKEQQEILQKDHITEKDFINLIC